MSTIESWNTISLGRWCSIKGGLRKLKMNPLETLPFDWIESRSVRAITESLRLDFAQWTPEHWYCAHIHAPNGHPMMLHRTLRMRMPHTLGTHDLVNPKDAKIIDAKGDAVPIPGIPIRPQALVQLRDMYDRRIARFREICRETTKSTKSLMFARLGFQNTRQVDDLHQALLQYCCRSFVLVAIDTKEARTLEESPACLAEYPHHPSFVRDARDAESADRSAVVPNQIIKHAQTDTSVVYVVRTPRFDQRDIMRILKAVRVQEEATHPE